MEMSSEVCSVQWPVTVFGGGRVCETKAHVTVRFIFFDFRRAACYV